jgi:hypothetical protein
MLRLRKAYESNPYEAEQLLKVKTILNFKKMFGHFLKIYFVPFYLTFLWGGAGCKKLKITETRSFFSN